MESTKSVSPKKKPLILLLVGWLMIFSAVIQFFIYIPVLSTKVLLLVCLNGILLISSFYMMNLKKIGRNAILLLMVFFCGTNLRLFTTVQSVNTFPVQYVVAFASGYINHSLSEADREIGKYSEINKAKIEAEKRVKPFAFAINVSLIILGLLF